LTQPALPFALGSDSWLRVRLRAHAHLNSFVASLAGIGGPWLLLDNMNAREVQEAFCFRRGLRLLFFRGCTNLAMAARLRDGQPGPTLEVGRLRTTTGSPAAARTARDYGDGFFEQRKRPNV